MFFELIGYTCNGNAVDWLYGAQDVYGVSIELGPENPTRAKGSADPFYPPKKYINQTLLEQYQYFLKIAA